MRAQFSRLGREQSGQALVLFALALVALLGCVALVVDVGSWFRSQRQLQSVVDAAALAAAQDLPLTTTANATANAYVKQNLTANASAGFVDTTPCGGGGAPSCTITFPTDSSCGIDACVEVDAAQTADGVFARVYGAVFNQVTVHAHARAKVVAPGVFGKVAPIAVPYDPSLECVPTTPGYPDCFGASNPRVLSIPPSGVTSSGSAVVDLADEGSSLPDCAQTGTSASDLRRWLTDGYPTPLPVGNWYCASNGEQNGGIKQGLDDLSPAEVLFFPVFDSCVYDSQNPPKATVGCSAGSSNGYHVVGFSAFAVTGFTWTGNTQQVDGYFVTYVASGSVSSRAGATDFGVHVVHLIG
jgi:Flp pilus assembly protein TadG